MANLVDSSIIATHFKLPSGTAAQRPTATNGRMRLNTEAGTGDGNGSTRTNKRLEMDRTPYGGSIGRRQAGMGDGLTSASPGRSARDLADTYGYTSAGWYWLNVSGISRPFWIDFNSYNGVRGWTLVCNNVSSTGGIGPVYHKRAVGNHISVNNPTYWGNSSYNPSNFNVWVGLDIWSELIKLNNNGGAGYVSQFVNSAYASVNSTHTYSAYFSWDGSWTRQYAWSGTYGYTNVHGSTTSGLWSYHIANAYPLTTHDVDRDVHGQNCAGFYGGHPWWFGACWDGNYWGSTTGSHTDAAHWTSSSGYTSGWGGIYVR